MNTEEQQGSRSSTEPFDARQQLVDLGVDLEQIRSWAAPNATAAAEFGQRQEAISQYESVQRLLMVGPPLASLLAVLADGVAQVAEGMSETRPAMAPVVGKAREFQAAMEAALPNLARLEEEVSVGAQSVQELHQDWLNVLPENLRGIDQLSLTTLSDFLSTEGIPLYLIPRPSTAEALLAARGTKAARSLLNTRAPKIIEDCQIVWESHRNSATHGWIQLLETGLEAYLDGHTAPAQALFTSVMDSIVWELPRNDRSRYTTHAKGSKDWGKLLNEEVATALAMLPLWQVYERNFKSSGDLVPSEFNRHATLHRASMRQYSKRNAIQAMMLATSVLAWFATYRSASPGLSIGPESSGTQTRLEAAGVPFTRTSDFLLDGVPL